MWLLMVEAGVALFLLVFIVWWTMYAGRKPIEQEHEREHEREQGREQGREQKPDGPKQH